MDEPFPDGVTVVYTRVLGKGQRLWDMSSGLRGNAKELEDSLVAVGWFVDDCPRYVADVRFRQVKPQKPDKSFTRIEVFAGSVV